MTETLAQLSKGALKDLEGVFAVMPEDALDGLIEAIVAARRIVVFGLGREGLQMRGFAMRLFHSNSGLYRHYIYTEDLATTSHVKIESKEAKKTLQQAGHRLTDVQ